MSQQQALAHVTGQSVQAQFQMQANYPPPSVTPPNEQHFTLNDANSDKKVAPSVLEARLAQLEEASEISYHADNYKQYKTQISNDGYNWRKYGQKHVKGIEDLRSYYKCTRPNCPVKKKVEHASDGHITQIIYKGQHNHEQPQANRHVKDNNDSNESARVQSDAEDMGDVDIKEEEEDDSEPNPKRRNTDVGVSELPLPHKTVTEPKIIVQTRSEVDILDDGYRWRKYGQKVVKGNPHPRSYYKCTSAGCNVRKHVERASMDPKAVITTYEGKHNHDVPGTRKSSHNIATYNSMPLKPYKVVPEKHPLLKDMDFGNNGQRSVHLRLKEEKIIV
ncbi:putative WRKY transcription factor 3, partial [Mucuna pruriens]